MELRHLRYLVAIVEEGSFVGAAKRLHVSQPPLSRQIKELEEELGVPLLRRSRQGVQPTAAGQAFFEGSRRLLEDVERMVERARDIHAGGRGRLRVVYSQSAAGFLVAAVQRFRERYPEVEVSLDEQRADRQAHALLAGDADLALGYRLPPLERPEVMSTLLLDDPLQLALPARGWGAGHRPLSELSALPLLTLPEDAAPALRRALLDALDVLGVKPAGLRGVGSVRSVLTMVGCGVGFGVVPASIAARGADGVCFVQPDWPLRLPTLAFQRLETAAGRHFIGIVHELLAGSSQLR